ncbi:MAG: orotate phosphoribosyltransferase [Bdellovibrionota bacterium]
MRDPAVPSKSSLVKVLRERSYREGDFTLASGKKSTFYLDVKETALSPEGAFMIGLLSVEALVNAGVKPYAVGGLTLGADPLATAVSIAFYTVGMNVPAFIVRKAPKDHGTLAWIEGAKTFPKGAELVVLEDVVTTGGSSLKAVEKLVEAGFKVSTILTVVDRLEGARKTIEAKGLKFISLCTLIDIRGAKS